MYPWQKYAFFAYLSKSPSPLTKLSANMRMISAKMLCLLTFVYILLRCHLLKISNSNNLNQKTTMKKILSFVAVAFCFCMLTTTFISCGDDKSDDPTPPAPAPAPSPAPAVTKADLIGSWKVYLNGAPVKFSFTDTQLKINDTDVDDNGAYTFENERLFYRFNGEDVSFNVEMIHNKTVILAISIIPASQSYSGEEERQTSFGYREGATIPVTASDIQGKWYWQSEHGFVGARAVLILDGDKFDLIITPWGERHIGTFTYQNGYIHLTPEESFTSRYDDSDHINIENPEATPWKHPGEPGVYGDPIYFSNPGDDVIPFIPNGIKAYGELANLQVEYTKK